MDEKIPLLSLSIYDILKEQDHDWLYLSGV